MYELAPLSKSQSPSEPQRKPPFPLLAHQRHLPVNMVDGKFVSLSNVQVNPVILSKRSVSSFRFPIPLPRHGESVSVAVHSRDRELSLLLSGCVNSTVFRARNEILQTIRDSRRSGGIVCVRQSDGRVAGLVDMLFQPRSLERM